MAEAYERGQSFGRPKTTFLIPERIKVLKLICKGRTLASALDMCHVSTWVCRAARRDDPEFNRAVCDAIELRDSLLFELQYEAAKGGDLEFASRLYRDQIKIKQHHDNRRDRKREFDRSLEKSQPKETFEAIVAENAHKLK